MCNVLNDTNYGISSLICLGYIAQEIKVIEISQDYINKCVNGIINILTNDSINDIVAQEGLQTLINFLPFLKKNFEYEVNYMNNL